MELKKTPKADLENKKVLFFEIGVVLALALTFVGFEWKSYDKPKDLSGLIEKVNIEEEIIPITRTEVKVTPPPPPAPTTVLNIVDNNTEVTTDLNINSEADENTVVEEYIAPVVEQKEEQNVEELEIFTVVEENPGFPGGEEGRLEYLRDNLKYPQIAKESGISGKVFVQFVVERNGAITDVKVIKGIGGGCDEEAIRVVKAMPKWTPGKQRGKAVRTQFIMPLNFVLQG